MPRTKKFKIYPCADTKWYVTVQVAPDNTILMKEWRRNQYGRQDGDPQAFFETWKRMIYKKGERGRDSGDLGRIVFDAKNLNMDTVAHECGHAAHAYCRRVRATKYNRIVNEEIFCYALGTLVSQCLSWFLSNGYGFKK